MTSSLIAAFLAGLAQGTSIEQYRSLISLVDLARRTVAIDKLAGAIRAAPTFEAAIASLDAPPELVLLRCATLDEDDRGRIEAWFEELKASA